MQSLEELRSGKLIGTKTLKIACGLKEFPIEILTLADTLEVLDLSDNNLTQLPDSISKLKHLKIIFFARNKFIVFPSILSSFPKLSMIGFKSNQITKVPENSFPPLMRWLILTDNKVDKLPKSIGKCTLLQKCTIAGNQIKELPDEMANCVNLELLRISANNIQSIPKWLFELPKLSWIAFGGNPALQKTTLSNSLDTYDWDDFTIEKLLGEGASGLISKANWKTKKQDIALKVFKGEVTSDGWPEDEMKASIAAGYHHNLIPVLGKIKNHPEDKQGLLLKLISPNYKNLGHPPSLESCTRDIFDKSCVFTETEILKIAKNIASVCSQLHRKGINHGDLYAHNILINNTGDCLLGDFGAATIYDVNAKLAHNIKRVEVRAFGCLLEDILNLVAKTDTNTLSKWHKLIANCKDTNVISRPCFDEIIDILENI